ncbi:MAG: methyltransferase domain-containing protein [Chitinophagaceae bacterium]|nr:methyltransferase domain-containing protein [Chitinophagaceae bacterium]
MAYNQQAHFTLEKELATELRNSSATDRKVLYQELYNKLFTAFPEIAHNLDTVHDRIAWQMKVIEHLYDKDKIFLEIGAGDCILSNAIAPHFKKVIAYEVASSIPFIEGKPDNVEIKIFNGVDMHEKSASVDFVYSNQVFEHLHPDDIQPILEAYHSYLKPGGKVIIITPHKLTGPHDVSRYFSDDAEGFHMKEYTYSDMKKVLKAGGFRKIKGYVGYSKWGYIGVNVNLLIMVEKIYSLVPKSLRKKMRNSSPIFNFFGLKIIAKKS